MAVSHWKEFHQRWSRLGPPLRPNAEVVEAIRSLLANRMRRVLLLGVTPELADLGTEVIAVDRNEAMIAHVWPGDTGQRRAERGDWLALPFPGGHFSAAIGDGSLNILTFPDGPQALYAQLDRVLEAGGVFVARVFMAPDVAESVLDVRDETKAGRIRSFHAFKWRLAMAIVADARDPNVKVTTIRDVFNHEFPDRAALSSWTGWHPDDIATIDVYRDSPEVYNFPTAGQLHAVIPGSFGNLRTLPVGTYELAERCPLVIVERRA